MNPILKDKDKIRWKFDDIDTLDNQRRVSEVLKTKDGCEWKIFVFSEVEEGIKHFNLYLRAINEKRNWLNEVYYDVEIFDAKGNMLKNLHSYDSVLFRKGMLSWGRHFEWSDIFGNVEEVIKSIDIEFDILYKIYDFARNASIFSDFIIKIGENNFFVSKGLLCSSSKYFNNRILKAREQVISLIDVSSDDFLILLAAILPDPIEITERTYGILLDLSQRFEMDSLKERCLKYFTENDCKKILEKVRNAEMKNDCSIPAILSSLLIPKNNNKMSKLVSLLVFISMIAFTLAQKRCYDTSECPDHQYCMFTNGIGYCGP
ncbi:unnamed protein product [Caenorhabditis angaria]|uniref:BTB domain-containing protein n=1 Tax=Caenorhabditis angaria TaxID=860376 RepID=A0A9P1N8N8_9PELO|nr:unnamed protein product [Caenorhabditis angaria]